MCNSCSALLVYLAQSTVSGQVLRATIPYIRQDIPIIIVFRALNIVPDREILQHICYDFADKEMMEKLRPSLVRCAVCIAHSVTGLQTLNA